MPRRTGRQSRSFDRTGHGSDHGSPRAARLARAAARHADNMPCRGNSRRQPASCGSAALPLCRSAASSLTRVEWLKSKAARAWARVQASQQGRQAAGAASHIIIISISRHGSTIGAATIAPQRTPHKPPSRSARRPATTIHRFHRATATSPHHLPLSAARAAPPRHQSRTNSMRCCSLRSVPAGHGHAACSTTSRRAIGQPAAAAPRTAAPSKVTADPLQSLPRRRCRRAAHRGALHAAAAPPPRRAGAGRAVRVAGREHAAMQSRFPHLLPPLVCCPGAGPPARPRHRGLGPVRPVVHEEAQRLGAAAHQRRREHAAPGGSRPTMPLALTPPPRCRTSPCALTPACVARRTAAEAAAAAAATGAAT